MIGLWIGFLVFVLLMLALDLGVFHRKSHAISVKESLAWMSVWVSLSLLFSVFIYFIYQNHFLGIGSESGISGGQAMVQYLTGYVVEQSLSMDNMFVIALILAYFKVPAIYQHRVLFWGIIGALVMRGGMIIGGVALVAKFGWVLYIFGAFLIYSAIRMLFGGAESDPSQSILLRQIKKVVPVTQEFDGPHFITRIAGKRALTPLALALIMVESADVVFAVDSIPAIFAITKESFLIFTSNVFAILGLRSLYFALAGMMNRFEYLKYSLSALLALIGVKMLLKDVLHGVANITYYTLGAIILILAAGVVFSIIMSKKDKPQPDRPTMPGE